jgi:arylsulfatase A-like enzyme
MNNTRDSGGPLSTDSRLSAAEILQVAILAGLLVGLTEAAHLAFRRHVLHQLIYQGAHYVWLAPLVNACIFLCIGATLAVGKRFVRQVANERLVLWILIFVAALALRRILPRIHVAAWLILACGLATFFSRVLSFDLPSYRRCLRPWLAVLSAAWIVAAAGTGAWLHYNERRAVAELIDPPASAANVLWLVMDTVPAKRLSVYGYDKPTTPRLEQFSRTGVVFDRCMSSSSWTLPGHGTMFTGALHHEYSCGWVQPFEASGPTIAEVLRNKGYVTGGFAANRLYLSRENGLARGFANYQEPTTLWGQAISCSQLGTSLAKRTILPVFGGHVIGRKSAADVNRLCLSWLAKRPKGRPYFAFVNYMDAHAPYVPSPEFRDQFGAPAEVADNVNAAMLRRPVGAKWLEGTTRAYEACLAGMDREIGKLLDELSRQGLLKNTVVIVTADHGEQLGENGLLYHANSLYLPQVHVPLIISYPPALPANRRFDPVVSLADLPATVMDLLGFAKESPFPRVSLRQRLDNQGSETVRDVQAVSAALGSKGDRLEPNDHRAPIAKGSMRSAISSTYQYILNGDGSEELYDYDHDPLEAHNLIDSPEHAGVLSQLRHMAQSVPIDALDASANSHRHAVSLFGTGESDLPSILHIH